MRADFRNGQRAVRTVGRVADVDDVLVGQLVELGLLSTESAPDDQRRRIVSLTQEGRRLVAQAKREVWPRINAAAADLCGGLEGTLLDQLAAIEDGLSALPLDRRVGTGKPRP